MPPSLVPAIGLALRALGRELWLVAAGLTVAALRRVLALPAIALAWALLVEAAAQAARSRPLNPFAAFDGVAWAASSPRFIGLVGGLWLAGVLAGAALRVAFVGGAAPVLAAAMAGGRWGASGFASALAGRFPRVLATAMLGAVAELAAVLFAVALALGAIRLVGAGAAGAAAAGLALAGALALTLAVAVPLAVSTGVDAAVARAAVRGEGPGGAFAAATRRFLLRPGAFLAGALLFGAAAALGPASVEASGEVVARLARGADPLLLVGPGLMIALAALALAAVIELAWLGTVSVLACGEEPGAPAA